VTVAPEIPLRDWSITRTRNGLEKCEFTGVDCRAPSTASIFAGAPGVFVKLKIPVPPVTATTVTW
jgi:hypothetical protein